jgi:hypothetical protein
LFFLQRVHLFVLSWNIAVLNLSCSNSCVQPIYPFQDQNRYNAGRGAHINLKRAEKARVLVSKIPCKLYTYLYFYISLNCRAPRIICVHYTRRLWYPYIITISGCVGNRLSKFVIIVLGLKIL